MAIDSYPEVNLAKLVEELANRHPQKPFCHLVEQADSFESVRTISWDQFRKGVNRLSFWLDEQLGPDGKNNSFVYWATPDITYGMVVVAAAKTQRKALIFDGNGKSEGLINNMRQLGCNTWIGTAGELAPATALKEVIGDLQVITIPSLDHWLQDGPAPTYPYNKRWEDVMWEAVFVLQTSGSTGLPKAIPMRHISCLSWASSGPLLSTYIDPRLNHAELLGSKVLWTPRPWWLGGIAAVTYMPFFWEVEPVIAPLASAQPNVDWTKRAISSLGVDGSFINPALIRDICLEADGVELLASLRFVSYSGAALDAWAGDLLCDRTLLKPFIGSTEMAALMMLQPEQRKDWKYYHFSDLAGYRMDSVGEGLFEMVIERQPRCRNHQGIFFTFPELNEYRTGDVYESHPTVKGSWMYRGRADDTFRLRWFKRVRATDIESQLERTPFIARALVAGEGRSDPFVIIELAQSKHTATANGCSPSVPRFAEYEIWAVVHEVNEAVAAECKIPRGNIIVAAADRPIRRTTKGSLNRPATLDDYADEIEELYRKK